MKKFTKALAIILVAAMAAVMIPTGIFAAEPENIALGATPFTDTYSHVDADWNWNISNINDGDIYEIGASPVQGQTGTRGGYHSGFGTAMPDPQWVGLNFGEAKTFNTVVIHPVNYNTFPNDFEIQVSDDGENWTSVVTKTDYSIELKSTNEAHSFVPQTFTFDSQNKQYVRIYATKLTHDGSNYAMKLTEFEVFNITETAPAGPVNLALGKTVESDSHHEGSTWGIQNINDGDIYNMVSQHLDVGQFAGYHLGTQTPRDGGENANAQITIELGENTTFNQFVIYPSHELYSIKNALGRPDDPNNAVGIHFPKNFKIQCSDDGETWTDIVVKEDYTVDTSALVRTQGDEASVIVIPQVFDFEAVTAKYVRLQMNNLTDYIKLSEIEVYNIVDDADQTETGSDDTAENTKTGDMAIVFIAVAAVVSLAGTALVIRKRETA